MKVTHVHPIPRRCRLLFLAVGLSLLAGPALAAAKEVTIDIKNLKYSSRQVTIKVGDTVTWVNKDDADHTVTADDDSFDSGNLGNGQSHSHKFTKAGEYTYHCEHHPRMKGKVVVQK